MTSKDLLRLETSSDERNIDKLLCLKSKNEEVKQRPKTFKLPPSSVLSQVKHFLPEMAAANKKLENLLESVPVSEVDIENVSENDSNYIEMNLALVEHDSSSSEESDSDVDVSSDSDCCNGMFGEVTENNIKMPKQTLKGNRVIEDITVSEHDKKNKNISDQQQRNSNEMDSNG